MIYHVLNVYYMLNNFHVFLFILETDMWIKYYILNAKVYKLKFTQGCLNRSLPRQV